MRVLVAGGAGYIGSHTVVRLLQHGDDVVIADNFSNSSPLVVDRLRRITGRPVKVEEIDLTDTADTKALMRNAKPDAVIHFAGLKAVGESVTNPGSYYSVNLRSTLSLLAAMQEAGVYCLVFSSSATVYGMNPPVPTPEDSPTSATNPYGWTKVMGEQILTDIAASHPQWRIGLLRYFNPGGAHPCGAIGEDPLGVPNNVLPYISQVAIGRRDYLSVFGDDYDTPDGTGVRDFIHVDDLAEGHVAALHRLTTMPRSLDVWNLGTGRGTSVLELRAAFEAASGRPIPYRVTARRPGDVARSLALVTKAERELGWRAQRGLLEMCQDAWRWQSQNPDGYR
ncbi:UDP-glucose 4-epimerase GalE [Gephyromycinifex aptenodytis]|uniref:UDP-glucose 4-epimerase GalE n=1 Tax=Gephyromycinifex aptenodytis TaxID=2716227 RepID=UPI001447D451|nr:UDP-glucose 4-epimerase GalE [Gephyromycinifex aptenodytis]